LAVCATCGAAVADDDAAYFSSMRSGVICRNCEGAAPDRMQLDPRLLRLTQTMLRLPRENGAAQRLPKLTRHQTDPINRIIADHVEHTLSRRLRMTRYVVGDLVRDLQRNTSRDRQGAVVGGSDLRLPYGRGS